MLAAHPETLPVRDVQLVARTLHLLLQKLADGFEVLLRVLDVQDLFPAPMLLQNREQLVDRRLVDLLVDELRLLLDLRGRFLEHQMVPLEDQGHPVLVFHLEHRVLGASPKKDELIKFYF